MCAKVLGDFLLNNDLGIIQDDDKATLLKEVKKINPNLDTSNLEIHDKTRISATVKATKASPYKADSTVTLKYLIERNLHNTSTLLIQWQDDFEKFLNETKRQMNQDVNTFSLEQKRTWAGDKQIQMRNLLHQLNQDFELVRHNDYIMKLYDRVDSLENDLAKVKEYIEKFKTQAECTKKADHLGTASSAADTIGSAADKIANYVPKLSFVLESASVVPVVGNILSGLSKLTSVYCYIQSQI